LCSKKFLKKYCYSIIIHIESKNSIIKSARAQIKAAGEVLSRSLKADPVSIYDIYNSNGFRSINFYIYFGV